MGVVVSIRLYLYSFLDAYYTHHTGNQLCIVKDNYHEDDVHLEWSTPSKKFKIFLKHDQLIHVGSTPRRYSIQQFMDINFEDSIDVE